MNISMQTLRGLAIPHTLYKSLIMRMPGIRLGIGRNGNPVAFHQRHSICSHPPEIHTLYIHHVFYSHLYQKKDHITKPNALSKIGDLSYGIYLFHIITLAFVAYGVRMLYNMTDPASNSMGISALFYILCVFLIFAITLYVSYYTVKYASKILPVKLLTLIGFQK